MITENSAILNVGRAKSKKQKKKRKKDETEDEGSGEETEDDSSEEARRTKSRSSRKKARVESKDDSNDVKIGNPFGSLISAKNREKVSKNSTITTGKEVIHTCVELCRLYGKDVSRANAITDRRRKSEVNIF